MKKIKNIEDNKFTKKILKFKIYHTKKQMNK